MFWTDPDDTETFKWKETRVVRKLGAPPENMYDGELVGYTSKDDQYGMTKNRFSTESSALLDFEYAVNKEYNEYVEEKCEIKEHVLIMYYRWFVVAEDGYVYPNSNSSEYFGGVNLLKNIPTESAAKGSKDANNADNSRYFKGCTRVVPGGVNLNKSPIIPMTHQDSNHYHRFMMDHYQTDPSSERQPLGYLATYITTDSAITFTSDPSFSTTSIENFRGKGYTNADLSSIISRLMFPVVTDQAGNIMGSYSYDPAVGEKRKADNIYYVYAGVDTSDGRTDMHLTWGGGGRTPKIYPPLEACYMARHQSHFIDDKLIDPTESVYFFPVRTYLPDCYGYLRKMVYPEIEYTTPLYKAIDDALLSAYEKVSVRSSKVGNFTKENTVHPEVSTTTSFIRVTNSKGEDAKPKAEQDALNTTLTITNTNDKSWWYYPTTGYFHKNCENSVDNNPKCSLQSVTGMIVAKPEEDDPIVVTMSGYYSSNNTTLDSNVNPIEIPSGSSLQLEFMMCMPLVYYRITPMDTVTSSNYIEKNSVTYNSIKEIMAIPGKNDTSEYGKVLIEISKLPLHGFKPHPAFVHYTNVGTAENPVPKKVIVPYILMSPFGGTIMESDDTTSGSYTRFTGNGIFNDPTNNPIKPGDYNIEGYNSSVDNNKITERTNTKLSTTIHLPPVNLASTTSSKVGIEHYTETNGSSDKTALSTQFPYLGYFNGIVNVYSTADTADDPELNHITNMSITGGLPFCTPTSITPVGDNIEIENTVNPGIRVYETSADRYNTIFRKAITNKGKSWHPATLSAMELIRLYYLIEFGTFDKYAMLENNAGTALIEDGAVIIPNYVKFNSPDNSWSTNFTSSFYSWGFRDKLSNCDSNIGVPSTSSCPLNFLDKRCWLDSAAYVHQSVGKQTAITIKYSVHSDSFYVSTYPQYSNTSTVYGNDDLKSPIPMKLTNLIAYAPFTTMCTGKLLLKYGFNNSWALSETRVTASKVWSGDAASASYPKAPAGFYNLDLSFHGFDLNCLGIVDNQNWDYAVSHSTPRTIGYPASIGVTDWYYSVWDYIHTKEIQFQSEIISERQKTFFRDINNPDVKFPTSYNPMVVSESYPVYLDLNSSLMNITPFLITAKTTVQWVPQTIRYSKDMDWAFLPGKPKWVDKGNNLTGPNVDFAPSYTPPGLWQIQSYWTNNAFPEYNKSTKTVGVDIVDPLTSKNVPIQDTEGMYDNSLLFYSPSTLSLNPQTLSSTVRSYSNSINSVKSKNSSCVTPQVSPNTAFTCHFMFVPRVSTD